MAGPKKSLGQHWLKDRLVLAGIADAAGITATDTVLEIGSRFISDMGDQVAATAPAPVFFGGQKDEPFYSDDIGFDVGDQVRSSAFGDGEIIDVDGMAVTIAFRSGQTKKLNAEYARLEKL